MALIQYVVIIAVLFGVTRIFIQFRKNRINLGQFLFWEIIWIFILLFGLFPSRFSLLSEFLGIGRIVDAVIYISIALLFYLMYKTYLKIEEIEHHITKITRHITQQDKEKDTSKK